MPPPVLLIANDQSRRGASVAPFREALERSGISVRTEPCGEPGALRDRIHTLRGEVSAVVLGGGDGTMHAAAPALHETGLPLGILPLGTANDLARSLGIGSDPAAAAAIVAAGRTRSVDLGTVNGTPYFNVASLGLSVSVTKRLTRIMKRRFGPLAYPIAAAAAVIRSSRFHASLLVDEAELHTVSLQIAAGNGRFYGGGAVVDEEAQIDDGMLHVYSLEPRARWRLLLMARAFRTGQHRRLREVRTFTCRTLHVSTRRPREIVADGEIVARTPAQFGVIHGAVRVFVP